MSVEISATPVIKKLLKWRRCGTNNMSERLAWCVFLEQVLSVFPGGLLISATYHPSIDFYPRFFICMHHDPLSLFLDFGYASNFFLGKYDVKHKTNMSSTRIIKAFVLPIKAL
mmetsp:Transcript_2510/g.4649  ORF Transcript_2510/g.4649 Transcript_2510/m.4649 type:complete len:113 (+) Transcript_2510:969-1307(+)